MIFSKKGRKKKTTPCSLRVKLQLWMMRIYIYILYIYRCIFFGAIFGKSLGTDVGMVSGCFWFTTLQSLKPPCTSLASSRSSVDFWVILPSAAACTEWNAFSFWYVLMQNFRAFLLESLSAHCAHVPLKSCWIFQVRSSELIRYLFSGLSAEGKLKATLQEPLLVNLKIYENVGSPK